AAVCDVSMHKNVRDMVSIVLKELGKIDILVNCAGFGVYKTFEQHTIDDIEGQMKTNFFGTVYCTKEVVAHMLERGKGDVVNVASMAGKLSFPNYSGYCASKFAVVGFTESIYHELKPKGINVHLVCPAGTQTAFFNHPSFEGHPHRVHYTEMMMPEEVAAKIINAINRNIFEIHTPLMESVIVKAKSVFPTLFRQVQQQRHLARQSQQNESKFTESGGDKR
ncbi:MAG: SDR family NAD(P)-dependent oxidoreductase, partial [Candidatus Aenigmarchaeota archaeon]|nr:SDR family NAD(P)-dependent oxidoreductase [Candidatus Aenigmarchaeota archaeon]